jgi:hypothetical protein
MELNPNHISGIHNYCDKWCERCTFTNRCAVFASEQDLSPEENDISNKSFWDKIYNTFADAMVMLQKAAADNGIDLNDLDTDEMKAYAAKKEKDTEDARKHPLIKYCTEYMMEARALLKNNEALKEKGVAESQLIELGLKDIEDSQKSFSSINENLEIIQWYLFQINVKFMRAFSSFEEDEDDIFTNDDSNGSAKVALIAADRCLIAWQNIIQLIPEMQDEVIPMLSLLQKIRRIGETVFPNAMAFIRPGLDE